MNRVLVIQASLFIPPNRHSDIAESKIGAFTRAVAEAECNTVIDLKLEHDAA